MQKRSLKKRIRRSLCREDLVKRDMRVVKDSGIIRRVRMFDGM
jgi:hypothetical protein